ncbi:hypothetical protein BAUCODRAFT_39585 [Baudoinia panamericana UAMH 10762]|uniref:Zn(2)-C6 fungal-type domain-containing protein n=1 Tax=Baudoinia panamericana (strain UAMH 10762) TaxID=717646 RepID=M2LBY3_BAUPA|nr:uncharacterized protein BAUCODRAFT_39585 [Baudoinia panamericana UAMH 10762]EMC91412.1 hypothetical protein BAUCODRAFT_39585 [Baudoinia panamericana UAMH 10762]
MQDRSEASSSQHRNPLPTLAPRASRTTSSRGRPNSITGRPGRLSHRSRAGCWTCRGRKVKCDEVHPRCGPCSRLNRDCDWEHRWNFTDATPSTQVRYTNVTTTGNHIWDPEARSDSNSSPRPHQTDNLPPFARLTTDEDRERKAEGRRPGTYSVIATPDSFADLPEYVSSTSPVRRRPSVQSGSASLGSSFSSDPDTVVLERFEETPAQTPLSYPTSSPTRRPSVPEAFHRLSITSPPTLSSLTYAMAPLDRGPSAADEHLLTRFRQYIARRLTQPNVASLVHSSPHESSLSDLFEIEAARFKPLHHAICALSALNLSYRGRCSMEEALQHYQDALSIVATPTSPDDLHSDGVFLRHFLLFIYDICVPIETDGTSDVMWVQHLNHLRSIAIIRHQRLGREPHGYLLWSICELDTYACLLGGGSCEFVRPIAQQNMLPSLDQQLPRGTTLSSGTYLKYEDDAFSAIQRLDEGVLLHTVKVAELAYQCRQEAAALTGGMSPTKHARWQANVSRLQNELLNFWARSYPEFLSPESPHAGQHLSNEVRYVFEHAYVLYQAAVIYSRTSMFPAQRTIPMANQSEVHADTERRCVSVLALASSHLSNGEQVGGTLMAQRHFVFPIFMAGVATTQPDVKIQAIDVIKVMETGGIGQNTYRTRQLLLAVCEEQRRVASIGGRMEQVDWLLLAKEKGFNLVNCGL